MRKLIPFAGLLLLCVWLFVDVVQARRQRDAAIQVAEKWEESAKIAREALKRLSIEAWQGPPPSETCPEGGQWTIVHSIWRCLGSGNGVSLVNEGKQ
jgi:hypothetical protein